jgi:hypothetical protein
MKTIRQLTARLLEADETPELVRIIRALEATRSHEAIPALVTVLDTYGPVGRAAVRALVSLGAIVVPAMRDVIENGVDEEMIRNAHRVLARLGDAFSARAQHAYCWADLDELAPVALDLQNAA